MTRLASRRGVEVDGDRVTVRTKRRVSALLGLTGLGCQLFLLSLYVPGRIGAEFVEDPLGIVAVHLAAFGLPVFALASLRGPALVADGTGVWVRRLFVPRDEVRFYEWLEGPNELTAVVVVAPDSPVVTAMPAWQRWSALRAARKRRVVEGVRVMIGSTTQLPLRAEELRALVMHATRAPAAQPRPRRPHWDELCEEFRDSPSVETSDRAVVVRDGRRELLRIDDAGVHAPMPEAWRTVGWEQIAEASWLGPDRRPTAVLFLHPGVAGFDLRGRRWRPLRRTGRPVVVIPWPRAMPFDLGTFTGLLYAHPGGTAMWESALGRHA